MLAVCSYLTAVISNMSFASITKANEIENARDLAVEDVNDNSPQFLQTHYSTSISEVGYGKC